MAERSGFFNAIRGADGAFDRTYRAEDYCDNLAAVIGNGVLRSANDGLKVTASGLACSVNAGRAWINGRWYYNDAAFTFDPVNAPTGNGRIDAVFLRLDKSLATRSVRLVYRQGSAAIVPVAPAPVRDGDIYELCLATVYIGANATTAAVTDTRGNSALCGWVYSVIGNEEFFAALDGQFDDWFSEMKDEVATVTVEMEHKQVIVAETATNAVTITLPQYDPEKNNKLAVYVNGIRDIEGIDYTVEGKVIAFANNLVAGSEVLVVVTTARDGSGIPDVAADVAKLQNKVATLESGVNESTYNYICNGIDDNVKISEIAKAWLAGGTDYASLKISVFGTLGITAAFSGGGTSANPYKWFEIGAGNLTNRKVIVDFSGCSHIAITCPTGSYNTIFFGLHTSVIGANVVATGGDEITMFSTVGGTVANAEKCRFWITSKTGYIARGGTFRDCRCSVTATGGNAYCFNPLAAGLLRLFGGEYFAYAPTGSFSMVVYVNAAQTGAVVNTYSINCPKNDRSGYVQSYAINCLTNDACCSFADTITTLPIQASGQNIRGTIKQSKPNMM